MLKKCPRIEFYVCRIKRIENDKCAHKIYTTMTFDTSHPHENSHLRDNNVWPTYGQPLKNLWITSHDFHISAKYFPNGIFPVLVSKNFLKVL